MANSKRIFVNGKMNLDIDSRLLPQGDYREAENIDVINTESSDLGTVQNVLSNKRLTYFDVGENPYDLGKFSDEKNHKLYWFTVSENGAFLFEWDDYSQIQSVVLADTRPVETRVLKIDKDYLITGIGKVYSQNTNGDLLLATDDNIEPLCINVERAKGYGVNGFEKEDIYLIKKPPSFAPRCTLIFDGTPENYIHDKFFCFAYRYRYLDGEYSALSSISPYQFSAVGYDVDYFDCINRGMVNAFNAVNIKFNTGDHRVTEIQIIAKQSNSNTPYIIETFNKSLLGWGNNEVQNFNFYNNKIYTVLQEKELFRLFDNVPIKAKSLTIANNIPIFGNYLEGFDLIDSDGNPLNAQHTVSFNTYGLESEYDFETEIVNTSVSEFRVDAPTSNVFLESYSLGFLITFNIENIEVYRNGFQFIMDREYASFTDLFGDPLFQAFIDAINQDISNNYNSDNQYDIGSDMIIVSDPYISFSFASGKARFVLHPLVVDVSEGTSSPEEIVTQYDPNGTDISINRVGVGKSCKTNRNYAVDLVYKDEFKRTTTVITSLTDTVYIPQGFSDQTNRLQITIPHKPPTFAKYFAIVVKAQPLSYEQIMITQFFQDGNFTWCLLQGDNKDKVKAGDLLIPKSAPNIITTVQYITVLEVRDQERNFLEGNSDIEENDLIEPSGFYMKIRPKGFSMNASDTQVYSDNKTAQAQTYRPSVDLDLFSSDDSGITDLALPQGSYVSIRLENARKFDKWNNLVFEKEYFTQSNYDSIEDWFNEVITNGNPVNFKWTIGGGDNGVIDMADNLELVRIGGKLFLKFTAYWEGRQNRRYSYVYATITVRLGVGEYIFETAPKEADLNVYYEAQEFEIVDDFHLGNTQDQDASNPAIIELDFFNCFVFGNGVESYKVRDSLLGNALNIDSRPNATSIEPYRAIRRFADWTYGEAFIESAGINGINVFNLSTANFKEGDKQYGSIQILYTRDTDIVSIQERKAFKILFGKDLLMSAEGVSVISKIPEILGEKIAYLGDNGIGLHPESFAVDAYRIYYFCPDSASPIRLSLDGTEEINNGLVDFFRDLTIDTFGSKKIGGYDPHKKMYALSSEEPLDTEFNVGCGNTIYKAITSEFTYNFNLNNLVGDIVLNYDIISGEVDILVNYNGTETQELGATGTGTITIERDDITKTLVVVTVTPVSESAIIQITNTCPIGIPLSITYITLCDDGDLGKTMVNRHSWGSSGIYSKNILFDTEGINNFTVEDGLEGVGKFPVNGSTITLQAYKSPLNTGEFLEDAGNTLSYLVTDENYTESDIETILTEATYLDTSRTVLGTGSYVDFGTFTFTRPSEQHNLYMVWDYRNTVEISHSTNILIYFDGSGSMSGTLPPLLEMRDELLKNKLLPIYNYDEDLYNEKVKVITDGSERTLDMLNINGDTPEGNVIVMVFQDEADNSYIYNGVCPQYELYHSDLEIFRNRLSSFRPNYYRGVIFQVETESTGRYLEFKQMLQGMQNGTSCYSGEDGLSDRDEIVYKYDIVPSSTAEYYLEQITNALSDFGINI